MKDSKRKEMLVLALGGIKYDRDAVSYTHLTLPTILLV